jgi:hypothetical protein
MTVYEWLMSEVVDFPAFLEHTEYTMSKQQNAQPPALTEQELEQVAGGGAPIFLPGDIDKTNGWTQGIDGPLNGTKTGWVNTTVDEPPGLEKKEVF